MSDVKIPEAIHWHDGMLLAPQHFRQSALRSEQLLRYHTGLVQPFHWGIERFRHDPSALSAGILVVRDLLAVAPDGLIVSHQESSGELKLDLRPHLDNKSGTVVVYLAVVRDEQSDPSGNEELARYVSVDGEPVVDEQTGPAGLVIPRLRPRLRLIAGTPPSRYAHFPLFEAWRDGTTVAMSSDFLPSMLHVPVDSTLGQLCERVALRIRQKALYLRDVILTPSSTSEGSLREQNEQTVNHLVAALPEFEARLYSGVMHPFALYTSLCAIAGHVAAIATNADLVPEPFPRYDHNALRETFGKVTSFILDTINDGISDAFHAIQFKYENGVFRAHFEPAWLQQPLLIGLRPQPGAPDGQTRNWMTGCVIGAESLQQKMRDSRVLGADRRHVERPKGLVAKRGTIVFELKADPRYLVGNETLELSNPVDPTGQSRPAEAFLFIGRSELQLSSAAGTPSPATPSGPRR